MTLFPNLIDVFNEALISAGEKNIAITDNSAFAAVFRSTAENIARRHIQAYPFSFSRKEVTLTPGALDDVGDRIYNLPDDVLKIRSLKLRRYNVRDYKVINETIVSPVDSTSLILDYTYPAPIDTWSADFYDALRQYYEGLIRKSVLQDYDQGNNDMAMAKAAFIEASAREFNSTGNRQRNDGGTVLSARYGSGRHG